MKNVLVTGATGFVGKYVVRKLMQKGYNVTATDIKCGDFSKFKEIECVESDVRHTETLESIVKNKDIIINVAGLVDLNAKPQLLYDINHQGVKNLCEVARNASVQRLIQVSSIGVYGNNKNIPVKEDDEKKAKNHYEISKLKGENEAFKNSKYFEVVVVRPSTVYGFGSLHGAILPLLAMKKKKELSGLKGGPLLSHIHAEDVARAILFLAEHPNAIGEAYNLADNIPLNSFEMTSSILGPLGIEVKESIPYSKNLFKVLKFIAQKMPRSFYSKINKKLEKKWLKFTEEHKLKQRFFPRIDPIWLDYLTANKVYSSEKLQALGFKFKFPDPKQGLKQMVEEYIERNHLPKV
ncbi:MAG: SDR family oxidoreductase [Nanoarchaeota archaeon]|nr:SDR family oxidoreductase [Nanoarchaeota archaeon]